MDRSEEISIVKESMLEPELEASLQSSVQVGGDGCDKRHEELSEGSDNDDDNDESVAFLEEIFQARCRVSDSVILLASIRRD